jgi:hypothetical protein
MICVIEIGLFIFGIIMLITGKMKLSAGRVVEGTPARLLGLLALLPLPLCVVVGLIYGVTVAMQNPNAPNDFAFGSRQTIIITVIEAVITLGTLAAVLGIGYAVGKAPVDKRQRLVDEWDDEEDDDRPRRRKAVTVDAVEDDAPRRRVSREDDEDRKRGRYRE